MIKSIYKLFLGILLATTIGTGIATFYNQPEFPDSSLDSSMHSPEGMTPAQQKEYDQAYRDYDEQRQEYERNTAIVAVVLSVVVLALGLTVLARIDVLADGLLLGSVFTLLYAIMRSFGSGDQKFIFLVTLVGLIIALTIGYMKFIKTEKTSKRSKAKKSSKRK